MVVYLSGAISNDPKYKEKFEYFEKLLAREDLVILNPVKIIEYTGVTDYDKIMEICLGLVRASDILINIDDGIYSEGRNREIELARSIGVIVKSLRYIEDFNLEEYWEDYE